MNAQRMFSPPYSEKLPPRALTYLRIRSTLTTSAMALVAVIGVLALAPVETWVILLPVVGGAILVVLLIELPLLDSWIVRHTTYEISDDLVRIARGRLLHRDLALSTAQILTVTVVRGPLLSRFGFAKVSFATITERVTIGPLDETTAEAVRSRVLAVFDVPEASIDR